MAGRINYVFDVDGTLTPSRLAMDENFRKFFLKWSKNRNVYLLTGSDHEKTIEQVGETIWNSVTESHQCAGNVVYKTGKLIQDSDWKPNPSLLSICQKLIDTSSYPVRAGTHIEERVGLLNISVVGRDCTQEQRITYNEWDKESGERGYLCRTLNYMFPELEASAGGQISIDIHERGKNKAQIRGKLSGQIYFYGDKTMEGGNDYSLASILKHPDKVFQVADWQHTYSLLKDM